MIADQKNYPSTGKKLKNYITPNLQPFRALFFIFFLVVLPRFIQAQKNEVDSLDSMAKQVYHANDSAHKIHASTTTSVIC